MDAVGQLDHREVVDLADPRDGHRRLADALPQRGLDTARLDVDDDVAPRERSVDRGLDAVGDRVTLLRRQPRARRR